MMDTKQSGGFKTRMSPVAKELRESLIPTANQLILTDRSSSPPQCDTPEGVLPLLPPTGQPCQRRAPLVCLGGKMIEEMNESEYK